MQGKKSFVLYADQREVFEELSNEDAGKLIKHIYAYVNDENPESEDKLIRLAFLPIKTQLKRDLKLWEDKKQVRSDAGKKGGLAKASNATNPLAKPSNAKQSLANLAVNVNVNDNVNENGNVNGNLNVNENYNNQRISVPEVYSEQPIQAKYNVPQEYLQSTLSLRYNSS